MGWNVASFFSGGTTSNYSRPVNCAQTGRSLEKKLRLEESLCRGAPAFATGQQVTTSHVLIFLTDHCFLKRNCSFLKKDLAQTSQLPAGGTISGGISIEYKY